MMPASASFTNSPAQGSTTASKRPAASTGLSVGSPSASPTSRSTSPKAGARWTMPDPSTVVTKSATTTRLPSPSMGTKSNGRR